MKRSAALTSTLAARQQRNEAFVLQRGTVAIYKGVGQPLHRLWVQTARVESRWLASVLLAASAGVSLVRKTRKPRPGTCLLVSS